MFTFLKTPLAIFYTSFEAQFRDHFFQYSSMINPPTSQAELGKLAPCAYLEKTLCFVLLPVTNVRLPDNILLVSL